MDDEHGKGMEAAAHRDDGQQQSYVGTDLVSVLHYIIWVAQPEVARIREHGRPRVGRY